MRKLLGALLVCLLLTPAADAALSAEPAAPVVPPLWAAPATAPAAGTFTQPCPWLSLQGPDRTVHIALPRRFDQMSADRGTCYIEGGTGESAGIAPAVGTSLRPFKETQVDPFIAEGGDDVVSDVVYAADVPVYGDRLGESLSYEAYNDGSPVDVHYVQTDGVRLSWGVEAGEWADVAADFEAAAASVSIDATRQGTCVHESRAGRATVGFTLDHEVRWTDPYSGTCYLILGNHDYQTRAIKVTVRPVHGLAATARVLAKSDRVRRLRRTGARQLDYVMLLDTARPRRVRVVQEGSVRVMLRTPASRWRHDRQIFDRLRDSLTTSSSSRESGTSTAQR